MNISADDIYSKIMGAAEGAFQDGWQAVKVYAPAEFRKMAMQLAEIADNVALYELDSNQGYSPETGKILFKMQRTACESVLVAITHLTLSAVQGAIDGIVMVLKEAFGGIVAAVL